MGLSLHPYALLRRLALVALVAAVAVPSADAQQRRHELIKRVDRDVKSAGYGLLTTARAVPMTVDTKAFRAVASSELLLADVPLTSTRSVDLDLKEFSVITPESQLTYTDDAGRHSFGRLSVRTFSGKVAGDASSDVYMAFADRTIVGLITTGGTTYQIVTDFDAEKRDGALAALAFPTTDLPDQKFTCGLKDQPFSKEEQAAFEAASLQGVEECPAILYAIRGAWDADFELYQEFVKEGENADALASYMVSMIAEMSRIYERDARVQITIGFLNVWTTAGDPYTQSAFMPIALDEAKQLWSAAPYAEIPRAFAQVMSAKNWNGIIGIANDFDVICNQGESITFQLIKKWDPIGGIAVLSHELGHLTGLRHTHSCTWQPHIDECAASESGTCFAGTTLTEGTIMSYCKQLKMQIHERQIPFLRNRVNGWSSCMAEAKKLEIARTLLHFPVVDMGNPVDSMFTFFFKNRSKGDVTVSRMVLTGDVYQQFEIVSPATPFVVGSCDSIGLRLRFKATRDTTHRAELFIFHDGLNPHFGGDQHFRVDVEAFAKNDKPAFGFVSVGNNRVNFGRHKVDAVVDSVFKNPKELYINIGTAPLRVDSTEIVGTNRNEFELVEGSAPFVLTPVQQGGKSHKHPATIRFAPRTEGQKEAWLKVWSNSTDNPVDSLQLVGEALRGPVLDMKLNGLTLDFGEVERGKSYRKDLEDFIFNSGTEVLSVESGVVGNDAHLFNELRWLDELPPGEGMDLNATFFAPDSVELGWKTALVLLYTNTPKGLDTIQVTAKLVAPTAVPGDDGASAATFLITPNPSAGDADIHIAPAAGELGREYTFRITDAKGQDVRVATGRFTADGIRTSMNAGDLASGVYYVIVTTASGTRSHPMTITR